MAIRATEIVELKRRVADLEERLWRNPRMASMPPSAELFTKPPSPSRAERRAAGKKQGKQPGAPGKHLSQVIGLDHVISHVPMPEQEVSGSMSTRTGATYFCAFRRIVSTMRKHNADNLSGLRRLSEVTQAACRDLDNYPKSCVHRAATHATYTAVRIRFSRFGKPPMWVRAIHTLCTWMFSRAPFRLC